MIEKGIRIKIVLAFCLAFGITQSSIAASSSGRIIDNTNTTFGWQVLNDKPPVPTLEVVAGPQKSKALQLSYQFQEGIWIALVKNTNIALEEKEGIRFQYKGSGACVNLKMKISDAEGTVFGYSLPYGTLQAQWKEVVAPRTHFAYLWGGRGPTSMNWNSIAKIEITLDTDKSSDLTYTIDTSQPGKITFYQFEVASTKGLKIEEAPVQGAALSVAEKVKPEKLKGGYFLIDEMQIPKGWTTMSDQDGKCDLSSKLIIVDKKTSKALKVDYDFGKEGIWNALILPTNLDLTNMSMVKFRFKGSGGPHALIFKVTDVNQSVFGYTLKYPANTAQWSNVVVPKNAMSYLYGGSGDGRIDWSNIQKIEITIDKKDNDRLTGTLYFRSLKYK